ncbi:MAG TPA: PA2169 family four-helix-bundle protein [Puia sp.]|nr:PA2169 family four-helix-bundle protein [Puia sp.]
METKIPRRHRKTLSVLNDLIRINIDRITAYEKAAHEDKSPDPEIRDIFYRMATESRSYVNDLHAEIIRLGGAPVTQSTIAGKLYLHWLNGKVNYEGVSMDALLTACVQGEETVQKIYRHALEEEEMPENIHQVVEGQLWALERAYQQLVGANGA